MKKGCWTGLDLGPFYPKVPFAVINDDRPDPM
jgi:hypothetical protein